MIKPKATKENGYLKLMVTLVFMVVFSLSYAQESRKPLLGTVGYANPNLQKSNVISLSGAMISFQDRATSPLMYVGPGALLSLSRVYEGRRWENKTELSLLVGEAFSILPASVHYNPMTTSSFLGLTLYNHYLHLLESVSYKKMSIYAGGTAIFGANVRINGSLNNNALGYENVFNVMGAVKLSVDVSRKHQTVKRRLFLYDRVYYPAQQKINFMLNIGLLNFNYRPGYSYTKIGEINGTNVRMSEFSFSDYSWAVNGWRIQSVVEFERKRPSGNGSSWAYVWDMVSMPGKFEPFFMLTHQIKYSVILNLKRD